MQKTPDDGEIIEMTLPSTHRAGFEFRALFISGRAHYIPITETPQYCIFSSER